MKFFYLTAIIALTFFIKPAYLQAQTKLNQVEEIKQFVGNWKIDAGRDTTVFWDIKSDGDAIECSFKYVTNAKPFVEGKQKWDYDKKTDKYILTSATTGFQAGSTALWFVSKNKSLIVPVSEISDPSNATFRLEMEFKTPEMFLQSTFVNNKIIKTDTFNRMKN
jgi:hypothetical protein